MPKSSKMKFQNSKIDTKKNNQFLKWKPYGGKSGSLKSILIVKKLDFKIFQIFSAEFKKKVCFNSLPLRAP